MSDVHEEGWQVELEGKSSLKWYRSGLLMKIFGQERYVKEFGSKGKERLRFRLRMLSAGLLGDRRGVLCQDGKCELCDEGCGRYCAFLVDHEEFIGDRGRYIGYG